MLKSSIVSTAFGAALLASVAAHAATEVKITKDQCATLWAKALGSSTGDLGMDQAKPYVSDFTKADQNSDKKLSSSEWINACDQGLVRTADAAPAGATSEPGGATSDRTPSGATERAPGAGSTGAAGTDAGQTTEGTSDRTPSK